MEAAVKSGEVQKDMLEAMIRLDDFDKNTMDYVKELLKKATTKSSTNSLFTHDTGLHERLDKIFPPTESGQRAAAMMQANIQKSVDGLRQAGAQGGSVNIQANSPVTTTVTQTQGRLARAPLDTASGI